MKSLRTAGMNYLQGIILGIAEIIPGVSGSTLALLFGIYDDFIELLYQGTEFAKNLALLLLGKKSVSQVKKQFFSIRWWPFGIPLIFGMGSAILALSSIMSWLLVAYTSQLYTVLFALSLPTIAIVYNQMEKKSAGNFIIAAATGLTLLVLFMTVLGAETAVSDPHPFYLFLGGMIAISAMVLPGVSGSFMLLVLGLYTYVVGLISQFVHGQFGMNEVINILFLLGGIGAGFLITVRLLKIAFASYRDQLMAILLGLLVSSWYVLWPLVEVVSIEHGEPIIAKLSPAEFGWGTSLLTLLIILVIGGGVGWLHHWADKQQKPVDDGFDRL